MEFTGINRNSFSKINKLLGMFPVVSIIGARQVGKTVLAKQLRPDWHYIDLEKPSDLAQIQRDPELFFQQFPSNCIIDEAQNLPELFPILRGIIDANRQQKGRFILTGSSSADLLKNISESLAGRIGTVELGTFKTNEIRQVQLSPFYEIFMSPLSKEQLHFDKPMLSIQDIHTCWFHGGYPEPLLNNTPEFFTQWMENYHNTYINRDIVKLFPRLNQVAYQRFISMLCNLSGTIINKAALSRDVEISQSSIAEYLKIAEGTFLWRELLSSEKKLNKSLVKMPKGYVRDSGLLHFLLRIPSLTTLYNHPIVGHSFESFVIEEIIKGLNATMLTNWEARYYRTRGGAEIDLILDGPFGHLPIEIKYGTQVSLKQLKALHQYVTEEDLPFGLLINQAERPMWINDKIYQLPATYL